jgi:hypothetical protein
MFVYCIQIGQTKKAIQKRTVMQFPVLAASYSQIKMCYRGYDGHNRLWSMEVWEGVLKD